MGYLITIGIIVGVAVFVILFLKINPVFGRQPSQAEVHSYTPSDHLVDGKFKNLTHTRVGASGKEMGSMLKDLLQGNPQRKPAVPLPMDAPRFTATGSSALQVTWFGHSASMLHIEGKTLLLDPMFGPAPSPLPAFGTKRYSGGLPFELKDIPDLDAVLLSHDHYDHLDYGTIRAIKDKVKRFIVPFGVKGHLMRWGVEPSRIEEHDWWDEFAYAGLQLACTPAKHFSGRSLTDRNTTLWCSWVIKGERTSVFFSGDSGYAPHFQEIGDAYGPFDLSLIECGQYDERWADIHMMPEQSVQAHLDVRAKLMMPIHWAGFTLAFHAWTDPVERAVKAAHAHGVAIMTPKIGETVSVGEGRAVPQAAWWKDV